MHSNATIAQDQKAYKARDLEPDKKDEELQRHIQTVQRKMIAQTERMTKIEAFMWQFASAELLAEYDEALFAGTVERITRMRISGWYSV